MSQEANGGHRGVDMFEVGHVSYRLQGQMGVLVGDPAHSSLPCCLALEQQCVGITGDWLCASA